MQDWSSHDDSPEAILERNLRRESAKSRSAGRPTVYFFDTGEEETVIRIRKGELRFCGNSKFVRGDITMMKIRDALMEIYPKGWEEPKGHMAID